MTWWNLSSRYDFGGGCFYSHTLNGIHVFVLPDSIEGLCISARISMQYHPLRDQEDSLLMQRIREYKDWNKNKGFEWDG